MKQVLYIISFLVLFLSGCVSDTNSIKDRPTLNTNNFIDYHPWWLHTNGIATNLSHQYSITTNDLLFRYGGTNDYPQYYYATNYITTNYCTDAAEPMPCELTNYNLNGESP